MRNQFSLLRGAGLAIVLLATGLFWTPSAQAQLSIDFSAATYTGAEGTAIDVTINISAAPGAGNSASVDYACVGGTAVPGRDYTPVSGTANFGATTTSVTFSIPTFANDWIVCDPTVIVRLSNPIGNGVAVILGTQNNDAPTIVTITKEAPSTATVTAEDHIRDAEGLLPLEDWVPLFTFTLTTAQDQPAYRRVQQLVYDIKHDGFPDPRPYDTVGGHPPQDTIQEFAIVQDGGPDGKPDGELSFVWDSSPIYRWNNAGAPYGTVTDTGATLEYNLDLSTGPFALTPAPDTGNQYFVVVRTSAYWFNRLTMSANLQFLRLIDVHGVFPFNCDGKPVDSYPEKIPWVASEKGYSSSFAVHDVTSGPAAGLANRLNPWYANAWNYPKYLYTPFAERLRPRYDKVGNFFDLVTGEWMDVRNLFPLEQWNAVIGITAHGAEKTVDDDPTATGNKISFPGEMDEVNVVLTDIGADPLVPGSGGFDPRTALHTVTDEGNVFTGTDTHHAKGNDFAFSGLWVFHDTNGNNIFDPPIQSNTAGVEFVDFPLWPYGTFVNGQQVFGIHEWEYVSFPPDGGDPWWKMKLQFFDGRRRAAGETPTGYLDPTPHAFASGPYIPSDHFHNYFVVVRPDSGYQDVSLLPGDGTGMPAGADLRAFIEPRRYNAFKGQEDGGIHFTLQRPILWEPWQNNSEWTASEPWWPQRTLNANNAKPIRNAVEIHDLVLTYSSDNTYDRITNVDYSNSSMIDTNGLPSSYAFGSSTFDTWLDPFGLLQGQFHYGQSVGTVTWQMYFYGTFPGNVAVFNTDWHSKFQYPYETAPFFNPFFDGTAMPPRSIFFSNPPAQPTLPDYSTWISNVGPSGLAPGRYPSAADWPLAQRATRILKQHIDIDGPATAILGINLVGVDDPVTNRIAPMSLSEITVAIYGSEFLPADLATLNAQGAASSGVALYEDSDGNGVYAGDLGGDQVVTLQGLAWRTTPELIDLTGDGVADDLSGDGFVDAKDKAWVLTLKPSSPWQLPISDERQGGGLGTLGGKETDDASAPSEMQDSILGLNVGVAPNDPKLEQEKASGDVAAANDPAPNDLSTKPTHSIDATAVREAAVARAKDLRTKRAKGLTAGGHQGDDLFVVITPSDKARRFEHFRMLVPATLPSRPVPDRVAGVQLSPANLLNPKALLKTNPEEGAVQDYYGHDNIEFNVPARLTNLTTTDQIIPKNSPPTEVLGIQCSTNRGNAAIAATGTDGVGGVKLLSVPGATWTPGAFVGYWLLDGNYEPYQITGNTATTLTLLSGTPKNGFYRIEKDPTFLEQVVVEVYEPADGSFKFADDLQPLDIDQTVSGLALYRDNDQNPSNRNGKFDPDVDIPLKLDVTPYIAARAGEPPNQVRFIFSTPGTDNLGPGSASLPMANQTRHRQWIPDTFGTAEDDPDTGPTFFVVVRTSNKLVTGATLRIGIVSWGPNTPTEPDPDTFPPPPVTLRSDEFDIFSEFPWGSRAIGFITFFKDPSSLDPPDLSGFNWVRSTIAQAVVTSTMYGGVPIPAADDVVINSVSRSALPAVVGAGGLSFTISGVNFGGAPIVTLAGITLTVNSATNTLIAVTIPAGSTFTALPVLLKVTNSTTGKFAVRDDLFTLPAVGDVSITGASPSALDPVIGAGGFPFTITGSGFGNSPKATINGVNLTITSATDTTIAAVIPAGTAFTVTPIVLKVTNPTTGKSQTRDDLFTLTGGPPPPPDVVISAVSVSVVPATILPGGLALNISGSGFGSSPKVTLQSHTLTVNSAADSQIAVTIPAGTTFLRTIPMTLTVSNPLTIKQASRDDLISIASQPTILSVTPNHGPSSAFPVRITGTNFDQPTVYFGETLMPVQSWTTTQIIVAFPTGGLPSTGPLDVLVINASTVSATLTDGFAYENPPVPGPARACFIATAAYGTPLESHLTTFRNFRDGALLKSAAGAALVDVYYTTSPAIADAVAEHPVLALVVRLVLTPVAWLLEAPISVGSVLVAMTLVYGMLRRRRTLGAGQRARVD